MKRYRVNVLNNPSVMEEGGGGVAPQMLVGSDLKETPHIDLLF